MRVVFYESGYASLGIQYLMSVLKARGHETLLHYDGSFTRDYLAKGFPGARLFSLSPEQVATDVLALTPEVVCFSMHSLNYRDCLEIVRSLKRLAPEVVIICGGIHVTLVPDVVAKNPEIDFSVVGEAEQSLPALLEALAESGVAHVKTTPPERHPGVWTLRDGIPVGGGLSPLITNLDELPFPDKAQHHRANPAFQQVYTIMASRGCHGACTYCASPVVNAMYRKEGAKPFRVRSVDNVIAELLWAKKEYGPKHIVFWDDIFGARKPWLREFAARYAAEIRLPYDIQTSSTLQDEESMHLLAESGCAVVGMGLQSVNEEVRRTILKRNDDNEHIARLIRLGVKLGLFMEVDLMMNLPGETEEHRAQMIAFLQEARPSTVNLFFLQYLPRTPIGQIALERGIITPEEVARREAGEMFSSARQTENPPGMAQYRLIPYQVLVARRFSKPVSTRILALMKRRGVALLCEIGVKPFLYLSNYLQGVLNKDDYFMVCQMMRLRHMALAMIKRKLGLGRRVETINGCPRRT